MKEPDDIIREIRELLGEDVEKIEEAPLEEKPKISQEDGREIEKLLSEIEGEGLKPGEPIFEEKEIPPETPKGEPEQKEEGPEAKSIEPLKEVEEALGEEIGGETQEEPEERLETIIPESKEQEEIRALLKEEVKEKSPQKRIKIPKKLIFVPLIILLILGIIGGFSFLYFVPPIKLKDAIFQVERKNPKNGREMFDKWIHFVFLKSKKVSFYNQLGEAYLSINEYPKASSIFYEAFKIDPYNSNTQRYILSNTLKIKGWEKAKEEAERMLLKDKKSITAYLTLSKYMAQKGEIKRAISYLENALKSSPPNLSCVSALQKLYQKDKQYDKVISLHRFLIDHLKIRPINPEIVTSACSYFIEKGRLDIVKPTLEELVSAFPKNASCRYFLSLSYLMEGNKEKAKENLKKTIEDEDYSPAYNLLGEILKDEGKYIEAQEAFSNAIRVDPNFGKAYYNLGDTAFYNLNDYSTSIKGYENARKNGYLTKQLSYNLGFSYYVKGRYKEAKDEFKNYKEDETILYNLGLCDCRLKNFSLAKEKLEHAASLYKERLAQKISPREEKEIYFYLSNIYNNLGLIAEFSGALSLAQERYWDAINIGKLSGFEHKEAFSNLTNFFKGKPNSPSFFSDKMDKGYIVP